MKATEATNKATCNAADIYLAPSISQSLPLARSSELRSFTKEVALAFIIATHVTTMSQFTAMGQNPTKDCGG
jgi:hypothetical protein